MWQQGWVLVVVASSVLVKDHIVVGPVDQV
uniref:Uncharacterized protein n=1 Tax=Arundo donax TaxID=35708 RepID=A0A0A9ANA2_ARUDO